MGNTPNREAVVKTGDMVEGRYRIIKTLGAGGMGTVFLAEHALIKRKVAVKILHQDLATDANVIERFMNEARAAGTLGHPNIVESTDMGFTHDHVPYIVYEYLEGTLLTDEIYRVGGLPVRRAVRIAEQITSALLAAHNAGIVHRDLKSDNIFLTDKDDALDLVKVLDFGVARFLESPLAADSKQRNMIMGTPEFMAPEQITAPDSVDKRADVYALGVILYEMLTARRPFSNDEDPRALMHRIVSEEPPPLMRPEVPHSLQTIIIERMLAKDPEERFQSMSDVAAALEQFLTRGDGTPLPRRRSMQMSTAPVVDEFEDKPETSFRLPKPVTSTSIQQHKPVPSRQTPWPVDTLNGTEGAPLGLTNVTLPVPAAKRSYAMYGVAGAGLLLGALGLGFGLKGGSSEPSKAPQTAQVQQPAPAPLPAASTSMQPSKPEKITVKLDSDIAGARVVFRRRVAEAPVALEVNASDIVELVEVSAPGYKTTRYWLTFDRPTQLKAHLTKGTGSVEATEEETLTALGEVIMIKDAAPEQVAAVAPAPVAAPVKAVEKAAPVAQVATVEAPKAPTRKVGRGSADEQPHVAATETAPVVEQPKAEPKAEEPKADVTAQADKPVPTAEPVAKKEQTTVEPAKVAVAPKAEPTLARPAIDKATVSSVISTHRPEVLKCFADGKKKNASMKGTISLQLAVEPSGKVHRVQVQSTLNAPLVAACVVKAANAWTFPTRSGADVATVEYPFTIN